ncbi:glycosyltransferase family 1 protein [archaeon SCG-AAA382B04]|nr:glycosyltransferase family 1 protein [archaeon SCG-AAA382B04]
MDIAYVTDVAYPWSRGGAEKRTYEIAKKLATEHQVTIYTMKWWEEKEKQKTIQKEGITYKAISPKKDLYKNNRRSISEALGFAIHSLKIDNNHDIIDFNIFPYLPCISGKLRTLNKSKFVVTWHEVWGDYWLDYLGKKGYFGKWTEKLVSKLPDQIISVSQKTQKDLKKLGAKSKYVPNGINYKEIQKIDESDRGFDVLFVGRLIPQKNVDILIKSLRDSGLSLGVVGDGPQRDELEEIAETNEVDVDFFGETSYSKLIGLIKSCGIFVLPSSREGFGITVLEAFACGKPVLTVDEEKNAAKNLVKEPRGLVVQLRGDRIKEGIDELLSLNKEKIEEDAKNFAKKFSWRKISNRTLEVYRNLLD